VAQLSTLGGLTRDSFYATLSETLINNTPMKKYNINLAIGVFCTIAVFNAALLILEQVFHHGSFGFDLEQAILSSFNTLWWSVNFVSYPLIHYFVDVFHPSKGSMIGMLISCGIFSALLWSAAAGLLFRRKYAA
jgi:hypothetical protein